MDASAWIAVISTVIAVGSAGIALASWREAKRSADASVRSAKAAEESVVLTREEQETSQRARLIIYDPRFSAESPGQATVSFNVRNNGKAAAHEVRVDLEGNLSANRMRFPRKPKTVFAPGDDERFIFLIQFPSGSDAPDLDFRVVVSYSDPSRQGGSAVLWWSIPGEWERQVRMEGIEFQILENGKVTSAYDWMDWMQVEPSPTSPTDS